MKAAAIIPAAGVGKRMGGNVPKQYITLCDRPLICHTLDRFVGLGFISELVIAVEPGREAGFRSDIVEAHGYPAGWKVVAGGAVRQESVARALAAVTGDVDVIFTHDGVRPFVSKAQIIHVCEEALEHGACILASPIKETVKKVAPDGAIITTVDRSELWGAETPQAFRAEIFRDAFARAEADGFVGTDESSLVERLGISVRVLKGDGGNVKVTTPADLAAAEALIAMEKEGI